MSGKGVTTGPTKVNAVKFLTVPQSVKNVREKKCERKKIEERKKTFIRENFLRENIFVIKLFF